MIQFRQVTMTYPDARRPALSGVNLRVPEGELCLVVGSTGSGKSTLLRAVNGLVPHFSGGRLEGIVSVGGRSTAEFPPRELADVVGFVGQDPDATFVTDVVEDELAYVLENLAVPPVAMRRRVEEVLDLLDLAALRDRPIATLSGGQRQRVAIGAVLAAAPRVLVLDEPTSSLDPAAAEEVLSAVARLVHDIGLTVLVAEHRLERVVHLADRVVWLPGDGRLIDGEPAEVLHQVPTVPPVVALGRLAGWSPLPLSVRDARRAAAHLRERLASYTPAPNPVATPVTGPAGAPLIEARGVRAGYGPTEVLHGLSMTVDRHEVVAVMGRNGAGKSTFLRLLAGLQSPRKGTIRVDGIDPVAATAATLVRHVGFVPQDAAVLLAASTVADELAAVDNEAGVPSGTARGVLDGLVAGIGDDHHPNDLSEGQRLALALAVVLTPAPPVVLLDEPTRGLDYDGKRHLVIALRRLSRDGHAVVLATHDVELVAELADRVVVLADGDVIADGPTSEVVRHSRVFAPQVARIMDPEPFLTVAEVARALELVP